MYTRLLPLALAAVLAGSTAEAQDELPYHQEQRLVVVFRVGDDLKVQRMDGSEVKFLDKGLYRFDAKRKSQGVLTRANYRDKSGPFMEYGSSMRGKIRKLTGGGTVREATVTLKVTEARLRSRPSLRQNILRAGELTMAFRVELGSYSSTTARYKGDVERSGSPFVSGELEKYYASNPGTIEIYHTKLSLENHLPQRRALTRFPAGIQVDVRPTPKDEIKAGPFGFKLTRDELNEVGAVGYTSEAQFPMVHESDYYGHYVSGPHSAQLVIMEDGRVWIRLGWGLGGRYHGWSHEYVAILSAAEYRTLETAGTLTVTGKASYSYGDEDGSVDIDSPASITLTKVAAPASSSSGLVGGLSTP